MSDLTTGNAINGAKVQSNDDPTDNAKTFAVPDDPNNPGGFYYLFSTVTGSHQFTAERVPALARHGDRHRRRRRHRQAGLQARLGSPGDHADLASRHAGARLHDDHRRCRSRTTAPGRRHVKLNEQGGGFQILGMQGAPLSNIKVPDDDRTAGRARPGFGGHTNDHAPARQRRSTKGPDLGDDRQLPDGGHGQRRRLHQRKGVLGRRRRRQPLDHEQGLGLRPGHEHVDADREHGERAREAGRGRCSTGSCT